MNAKRIQVCMRQLDTHIRYALSCFTTKGTEHRKRSSYTLCPHAYLATRGTEHRKRSEIISYLSEKKRIYSITSTKTKTEEPLYVDASQNRVTIIYFLLT